jgi:hypothetical protein
MIANDFNQDLDITK